MRALGQRQAVQQCGAGAVGPAGRDVLGVGGQDLVLVFHQRLADGAQAAVLPGPVGVRHLAGSVARAVSDRVDGGLDVRCRGRRPCRIRRRAVTLGGHGSAAGALPQARQTGGGHGGGSQGLSHASSLGVQWT